MSEHNKGIENTHTPKNRYKGSVLYVYVKIKTTIVSFTTKQTAEHFSESDDHSVNAGVRYKNREFVTHSKLPHHDSAVYTFIRGQKWGIMLILAVLAVLFISNPVAALGAIIAFLSIIYFLDSLFTLYLVRKNLNFPSEVVIDEEELKSLKDSELPVYTILAPLYKEFEVLPDFVENIKQLDYPKKKLDVVLLLEENDAETIALAKKLNLPKHFRTLIVPHSKPKTKPKACNYGLWHAKGEYVVIYDAEDRTDPQQLKKAFLAFKKQGDQTACIQAKLNYFNSNQNLLTRFFTAEYSLWFDVILPGFQSINTPIPLGGTSNHFKVSILKELHGWDAFNVTEDCDLGIRLFKKGYKTAIIDSVTWEEANSEVKNWIRQRSRWIKGYLQTYLVHMRRPLQFLGQKGIHWFIFQLIIGMRISFIVINPILWAMTIAYFLFNKQVGNEIEALYPAPVFYMAVFSLVFGNFVYLYNYMIGLAKRGKWDLIKYVYFVPLYWLLMAAAAWMAIYQLFVKPHHWEKTNHGLVKDKKREWKFASGISVRVKRLDWGIAMLNFGLILLAIQLGLTFVGGDIASIAIEAIFYVEVIIAFLIISVVMFKSAKRLINWGMARFKLSAEFVASVVFIGAGFIANFLNYLYNAYLTRTISLEDFGVVSLVGSFLFIVTIPLTALLRAITQKVAFHFGRDKIAIYSFWKRVRTKSFLISIIVTGVWIVLIPFMTSYFNLGSVWPLVFISPMFLFITLASVDQGYLNGLVRFYDISIIILAEGISKLFFTWLFVSTGNVEYVYLAIPISLLIAMVIGYFFAVTSKSEVQEQHTSEEKLFPTKLFVSYTISRFAVISYLTFDTLLSKHFLSPLDAGKYALIALEGKIIVMLGAIISQPLIPLVSKRLGENKDTSKTFFALLSVYTAFSTFVFLIIGVFGYITAPLLLGEKATLVTDLLPIYSFGILCFSIASFVISYKQTLNKHLYAGLSFVLAVFQIILISILNHSLDSFVYSMAVVGVVNLVVVLLVHFTERHVVTILRNIADLGDVFTDKVNLDQTKDGLRILVFSWRDTKHTWAGGSEVYIHELSKRFIKKGHQVTVICGNDQWNQRHEVVDGVNIVRIGGFYTVYVLAFVYYIVKLRGKYNIIIDTENGIPFFTPLYTKTPVISLIHHVHQDVFRNNLPIGLKHFALFLEGRMMPIVYRNIPVITVSHSSKKEIQKIAMGQKGISIVHPGVAEHIFDTQLWHPKTEHPQLVYVGRIKPYKSLETAIKSVKLLEENYPEMKFVIAGFGENQEELMKLTIDLGIDQKVIFTGHVTEEEKVKYLSESWVFVQPSQMEGWGISVIEANAAGTPVVASNVPGLNESVQNPHTGFLVKHGEPKEFAAKISELFSDTELRKKYESNAVKWASKFSWDESAESFLAILERRLQDEK